MMGGKKPHGFTIVETMIFLAISGILLVTAINLINGKQNTAEFGTGIRQVQNQLQGLVSNVSEGQYTSDNQFNCAINGSSLLISSPTVGQPANAQGTNLGCQYIGEAIQFAPNTNTSQYAVYPVAGKQFTDSSYQTPVNQLSDTAAEAIDNGSTISNRQIITLPYGITVSKINNGLSPGMIGLFNVGATAADGRGTNDVTLVPFNDSFPDPNPLSTIQDQIAGANPVLSSNYNPSSGVQICFQSGSTNQYGVITIGGSGNPNNVNLEIKTAC